MSEAGGWPIVCGGDLRPGPRDACPNSLHDYPLPAGYVDAGEVEVDASTFELDRAPMVEHLLDAHPEWAERGINGLLFDAGPWSLP